MATDIPHQHMDSYHEIPLHSGNDTAIVEGGLWGHYRLMALQPDAPLPPPHHRPVLFVAGHMGRYVVGCVFVRVYTRT